MATKIYSLTYRINDVDITVNPEDSNGRPKGITAALAELRTVVPLSTVERRAVADAARTIMSTEGMTYLELPSGAIVDIAKAN